MNDAPAPLIACQGVGYAWPGSTLALTLDDFTLAKGERLFLCGPSGSGKSTLLGLLSGVLQPSTGQVSVLGQQLSLLRAPERDRFRADHIGYVFQQFNLLPFLDPVENVLMGCAWSRERRQRAGGLPSSLRMEAVRLLQALELDGDAIQRTRTSALSVGQQQRVAAARALIGGPALLLADEPTSALDGRSRDAFLHLLLGECARHGTGVLFVSHDMALARHFDRAVTLGSSADRMVA
ncbi:ABC transporter ATP-binding protein [Rothia nasimurium]|uniref:ABC transporter ATP-binding protein n=1 Tax=Luteibacter anthropi TaxID=564369 RepID=A0A7X5UAV4_9GAMM|nr:ABC transporter ATP-binding protein [Luteibacter anthropi]NII07111.1 ABC transporter ATP-binding protein [Luteibacter anthropi]